MALTRALIRGMRAASSGRHPLRHPPTILISSRGSLNQLMLTSRRSRRLADHHSAALAHQFDDPQQQIDASTLGMWAFLATEVLFFGGLFAAYTIYRMAYSQAFAAAS